MSLFTSRSTDLRVRLARFPAAPASPGEQPPLRARQIKTRTGCQQCKKRRLKCDETQPICRRCQLRGDDCSGSARVEQWQTTVLSPAVRSARPLPPLRPGLCDDDLLHYFAAVVIKDMVLEVNTATPLPPVLDPYIRRSKALLHAARSLSIAHLHRFEPSSIPHLLNDYQCALVALRKEVEQEVADKQCSTHDALHRLLLGALFLIVLHAWFNDSGKDSGLLHLRGATATIDLLLASACDEGKTSVLEDFMIGAVAHVDMLCSHLVPARHPLTQSPNLLYILQQDRWRSGSSMHPICGLSAPLCPIVGQAGRYYRSVVDLRVRDPERERELEHCLLQWQPIDADDKTLHVQIADGYRVCGLIMLHQARRVHGAETPPDAQPDSQVPKLHQLIFFAMAILRDTPRALPQVNFEVLLLLIAGPEIGKEDQAGRALIETRFSELTAATNRRGHTLAAKFVREYWQIRDEGREVTWLEYMVERELSLNVA